jgi:DNA replicative helicase MCM subunit Mcm2 (Cdc46/Mcm family)
MISFGRIEDKSVKILDENVTQVIYNDDDKNLFAEMADSPTVIKDLIKSFAPSIYGNE